MASSRPGIGGTTGQEPVDPAARQFFGEFVFGPDVALVDLCESYGIGKPPGAEGLTLAEIVRRHLPHPVIGDSLRLGDLQLVVRKIDGDRPVEIGLRLPH